MRRDFERLRRGIGPAVLVTLGLTATASAAPRQDPADYGPPAQAGVEVLTRGPLHEAFAEPVVFDPKPGPVVPKEPPPPIEESPPDQKPEGANVQWIPGYWAWDDSRNDYLWISGLWRDIPPGRQWVPGYWAQDSGGFRYVPGAWVADQPQGQAAQVEYLPAPPNSLESGPNSPAPTQGATWSPGCWVWQADRYAWRPGFWVNYQPDWVWVPAHYVWSPGGYLFVNGYWDRPITSRGTPFAPVYFSQPVYRQPRYVYTPTIGLLTTALVSSLFVRPSYHQYYFGDYYAANNFQSGIYPSYSFHQSRYGYDPLFAQYSTTALRRDPAWLDNLHDDYRYRRDHPEARPPHTYAELRNYESRVNTVNSNNTTVTNVTNVNQKVVNVTRNLVMARPVAQIAANPRLNGGPDSQPVRFVKVDENRRREIVQQNDQVRKFREQRLRQDAARPAPVASTAPATVPGPVGLPQNSPAQPRRVNLARSPIGSGPQAKAAANLPSMPAQPSADPNVRPLASGVPRARREPHPDERPQALPGQRSPEVLKAQQQRLEMMKAQQGQQDQRRQEMLKAQQAQEQQRQQAMKAQQAQQEQRRLEAMKAQQLQEQQKQQAMKAQQVQAEQRRQELIKAQQQKKAQQKPAGVPK